MRKTDDFLEQKAKRTLFRDFWTNGIGFIFNRGLWTQIINPYDQARSPTTAAWRKHFATLALKGTTKGKKRRFLGVKW